VWVWGGGARQLNSQGRGGGTHGAKGRALETTDSLARACLGWLVMVLVVVV